MSPSQWRPEVPFSCTVKSFVSEFVIVEVFFCTGQAGPLPVFFWEFLLVPNHPWEDVEKSGDRLYEDLATSGYKSEINYKSLIIFLYF
jgi:hypothetical protein